ncbi:MAG: CapA family protein [Acidobacteria bacterium]|nr:CapA family protein [Acidobacteriota bacterium]
MSKRQGFLSVVALASAAFVSLACQPNVVRSEQPDNAPVVEPTPRDPSPITIVAVGDIMMGSPFPNDSRMPPNDGKDLFTPFKDALESGDITFGNLEGPMTDGGVSAKCGGRPNCFAFRMPTRYGQYLKDAGFDVMGVANNHAGDFGEEGRLSTLKTLDSLGIKHAGTLTAGGATAYLTARGKKVAVIGFGHNLGMPSINNLENARQLVLEAKKNADIVIVSYHGGGEGTDHQHVVKGHDIFLGEDRGDLPAFTHTVIDAGADLVLGHGPHVMRGMEIYKGHLIEYSMGNFCTYGWFGLAAETALTEVLEIKIAADGKFISAKIHPGKQEGRGGPIPDPSKASIGVLRNLSTTDFGANAPKIDDEGNVTPPK